MSGFLWPSVLSRPALLAAMALAAAAIGWSLAAGVRSRKRVALLATLRFFALAGLLAMLLQPQQRRDEITVLRPQLAVLVDASESMKDPVDKNQPLRATRVLEWLRAPVLTQARKDFDVQVFSFHRSLSEPGADVEKLTFSGGASNVRLAADQVLERFRGQPLAAVLLLSDGLESSGATKADALPSGIPVFTFELEKPFAKRQQLKRISLVNVDYRPRVVVGWDSEIRVTIAGSGLAGQTASVELWRDGRRESEAQVAFNEDEQTRQAAFAVAHNLPGAVQYEIRVNDPGAEKEARSFPFVIEVMEAANRVLYVQNSLGFDFKFLRKAIVSDRNLQFKAFVRWPDGRLASIDDTGAKPESADLFSPKTLAGSAVLILGDLAPDALPEESWKAVRDFVDHGGGLVLLGGPNLLASDALARTALGPLLPVRLPAPYREGKFPVQITDAGLHHPVFGPLFAQVKEFPPLLTRNVSPGLGPSAEVLMQTVENGNAQPLVAASRFGQGRVVVVLTDTMWRWRLASSGWTSERSPHDVFWTQLMDWLIPKEQEKQNSSRVELFTERMDYAPGEHPEIRAIVRTPSVDAALPATLPLQLRTPDDRTFDYTMKAAMLQMRNGKAARGYRVEVEPNVPGVFRASTKMKINGIDVEGETRFVVSRPPTEITGKPINREFLKRLAEATGGKFYSIENWNDWRGDLHFKEQHFSRVQLLNLWNHPLLIGAFMALLVTEWIARKAWNMP